jgi:hypothetical protein
MHRASLLISYELRERNNVLTQTAAKTNVDNPKQKCNRSVSDAIVYSCGHDGNMPFFKAPTSPPLQTGGSDVFILIYNSFRSV